MSVLTEPGAGGCVCAMAKLLLSCGSPEGQPRRQLLRNCWCSPGAVSCALYLQADGNYGDGLVCYWGVEVE